MTESDRHMMRVMEELSTKGFSAFQGSESSTDLDGVLQDIDMWYDSRFEVLPAELAEGLLGAEGTGRMARLQEKEALAVSPGLAALDERMFDLGSQLGALSPQHLGFELISRDRGFLCEAGSTIAREPAELSVAECYRWLTIFEVQKVMCLVFLGPGSGSLELTPFDGSCGAWQVPVKPGTWVLLRADMMAHRFLPEGPCYVLTCFYYQNQSDTEWRRKQVEASVAPIVTKLERYLLDTVKTLKETVSPEEFESLLPRELQRMTNHMYHKGQQAAIRGCGNRFPGRANGNDPFQAILYLGLDTAEEIPISRWDIDQTYVDLPAEDLAAAARQRHDAGLRRNNHNCKHASFIEGIEFFDNKFFGISTMETNGMDPSQRQILEVFYEVAFSAGLKKSMLMKSHTGVYVAANSSMEMEWSQTERDATSGALASTSGSVAITSNRISYAFGLNGPNFFLACDAAASLVALGLAVDSVQRHKPQCQASFALGVDFVLHSSGLAQYCWAGQMSRRGRCFSFDRSADGYIRGEGCGGVYVNSYLHEIDGEVVVDEEPRAIGLVSSCWTQHSGRTATLTSPSGAMDQELIMNALRVAELSPLDVDQVEADGVGGVLADAVEAQALLLTYRGKQHTTANVAASEEEEVLALGSVKTTFGNGKPLAGMYAILKVLRTHQLGSIVPSNHLYSINPHMMLEDHPAHFPIEHMPQRMNSCFSGITAKGFGGSCAHAILWGSVDLDRVAMPQPILCQQEFAYWPGGGGELDIEAKPHRSYTIAGTWSPSSPEPMKLERDAYCFTVTIGELGYERFQIWLDGDREKALHPGTPQAGKEGWVLGPASGDEAEGHDWEIRDEHGETRPGDKYLIRLLINGRYRMVTWSKVAQS